MIIYPVTLQFSLEEGMKLSEIDEQANNYRIAEIALQDYYDCLISEDDLIAILESCNVKWEDVANTAKQNMIELYGIHP